MSLVEDGAVDVHARWPSVSVVVPTRDRPQLLRRALSTILSQQYPGHVECLIVFDGTSPEPPVVPVASDREVRALVNDRSPGLAGARNTGILAARGELIAFCDDDDEWHPQKLRRQVAVLTARPDASAVASGLEIRYGGHVTQRLPGSPEIRFRDLLESRVSEIHPSAVVARRDVLLNEIGLVDEEIPGSYAEDYEWLLRAAKRGPIVFAGEPLLRVHWHESSYFAGKWDMIVEALGYLLRRHPELRSSGRGLARIYGQIAFAHAAAGRRAVARVWARRTLELSPLERRGYLAYAISLRLLSAGAVLRLAHRRGRGI